MIEVGNASILPHWLQIFMLFIYLRNNTSEMELKPSFPASIPKSHHFPRVTMQDVYIFIRLNYMKLLHLTISPHL